MKYEKDLFIDKRLALGVFEQERRGLPKLTLAVNKPFKASQKWMRKKLNHKILTGRDLKGKKS